AYAADNLFKGRMRDFRLYDRALGADELARISETAAATSLVSDAAALDLGDLSRVTANLVLPQVGPYGSSLSWSTSDEQVVTAAGVITTPQAGPRSAVLTATLSLRGQTTTKDFPVTVGIP